MTDKPNKKPVSAAQMAATKRYEDKKYDKILLRLPKDSVISKENISDHAEMVGESVNGYIQKAIEMRMRSESGNGKIDISNLHDLDKLAAMCKND